MILVKLLTSLALVTVCTGIVCYHCYRKECRANFDLDDQVKLDATRECKDGAEQCFIYFLRSSKSNEVRSTMRVCGMKRWTGFMTPCDNVTGTTRSCYCDKDYCNGPDPEMLKLQIETQANLTDGYNTTINATSTHNATSILNSTTTNRLDLDEEAWMPAESIFRLIKGLYAKSMTLLKRLW